MKKQYILFVYILCLCIYLPAQPVVYNGYTYGCKEVDNIVPNHGFEEYTLPGTEENCKSLYWNDEQGIIGYSCNWQSIKLNIYNIYTGGFNYKVYQGCIPWTPNPPPLYRHIRLIKGSTIQE